MSLSETIREECYEFSDHLQRDDTFGKMDDRGSFAIFLELVVRFVESPVTSHQDIVRLDHKIAQLENNFVATHPIPLRNVLQLGVALGFDQEVRNLIIQKLPPSTQPPS